MQTRTRRPKTRQLQHARLRTRQPRTRQRDLKRLDRPLRPASPLQLVRSLLLIRPLQLTRGLRRGNRQHPGLKPPRRRSLLPMRSQQLMRSRLLVQRKKRPNRKESLVSRELTETNRVKHGASPLLWTRTVFSLDRTERLSSVKLRPSACDLKMDCAINKRRKICLELY